MSYDNLRELVRKLVHCPTGYESKWVVDLYVEHHWGEQDVVVKNITTNDPFLTKLCSNNGNFRGFVNEPIPINKDLHIEDPDFSSLETTHQIRGHQPYTAEFTIWASTRVECGTAYVQTQESITQPSVAATETTPRGKTIEADAAKPPKLKQQGMKRKVAEPSAAEPPFRIYHMNRGRSERIFNQKMKKTGFGPNGEGSTADKAFSL
nr:pectin lyase-like superfamily protein [Tanacetum cinerariifolium]